jgi:hypothetical protein
MKKLLVSFIMLVSVVSCSKDELVEPTSSSSVQQSNARRTTSVQCTGTTQSGSRCKNKTLSSNSRCYLHGGN